MEMRIKNLVKHLRWRFLEKELGTFSHCLFLQKTPSQKSGRAPNMCHKIVVRKLPRYKLKKRELRKLKIKTP